MRIIILLPLCLVLSLALPSAQGEPDETLDIYVIDVEGGEATLFVGPSGESLLVDAGWPGLEYRDADRIAAVAREAGVTQIDYLLVTHFHTDHMGGAMQLAERLPIRHFIDHGETVDTGERQQAAFDVYTDLRSQGAHRAVAPGDTLPTDGLDVVILASGGAVLDAPLAGAGGANPYCDGFMFQGEEITSRYGNAEDDQSIATFVGFGQFRSVIMGDLNWNLEHPLMCPDNKIGTIDLYLVSHHGSETSGSEALVHAIEPRAAVMNNGPRKGGAVQTFEILAAADSLEHLWQNHYSIPGGDAHNSPEQFIANLEEGTPAPNGQTIHMGPSHSIHVAARRDGSFTVTNSRNGFTRTYGPRE